MLQVTKKIEYSLIALSYMRMREGRSISAREVAEHNGIPLSLTANLLKALARKGLVATRRGAAGGYTLGRDMQDIRLGEVFSAVEGTVDLTPCCRENGEAGCDLVANCAIKSSIMQLNQLLSDVFRNMSLEEFFQLGQFPSPVKGRASAPVIPPVT